MLNGLSITVHCHWISEIDECQSNPCYNHATCIDRTPGWDCVCFPGYTGHQCAIGILSNIVKSTQDIGFSLNQT